MRDDARLDRLRAALAPATDPPIDVPGPLPGLVPRRAAVLVLLYPRGSEVFLVLERRPAELPEHAGQISLPGGGLRADDVSFLAAAQRETWEELGVPPGAYDVWGRLELVEIAASNHVAVPFVGFAEAPPAFRPSPREVAELLQVPLWALLEPATLVEEIWELRGASRRVAFYRHGEHKIWGATARVLGQMTAILRDEPLDPDLLSPGSVVPWP
jgi:8-oxo-dGTP pyrophosphatase MutT (NUDIX family)